MTFRQAYQEAVQVLRAAPVATETPELDARVLLGHAAGLDHAGLLARWPEPLGEQVAASLERALRRRSEGEPVAYITGVKEFMGLEFQVGPGLLVPRADTETLVEAGLGILAGLPGSGTPRKAADVCTGTGCVAVSLASLALEPCEVWACDLSPVAVAAAAQNSARLLPPDRRVRVLESDLLSALPGGFDLILSNPPYLTPDETRQRVGPGGWKEPALALDGGGDDGLELIRRLVPQAAAALNPGGWLLIEAGGPQMALLTALLLQEGLEAPRIWCDLAGVERVAGAQRPERR